jgi:hypothetical protein
MKRGRPKMKATDRRNVVLRLRLTREEYSRLCAAAKKAGETVSEYARKKFGGYSNGKH